MLTEFGLDSSVSSNDDIGVLELLLKSRNDGVSGLLECVKRSEGDSNVEGLARFIGEFDLLGSSDIELVEESLLGSAGLSFNIIDGLGDLVLEVSDISLQNLLFGAVHI